MRNLRTLLLALGFVACGARTAVYDPPVATGGAPVGTADGGLDGEATDARADAPDGEVIVPSCTGSNSQCVYNDAGKIVGAAIIKCDGIEEVGPVTVLLERRIGTTFTVLQSVVLQEPGYPLVFDDDTGPPAELTYRVCLIDHAGTRCGAPLTTFGPVDCACLPYTCEALQACDTAIHDGCGDTIQCGDCSGGVACNGGTCCPTGFMPDGLGGCVCAPPPPGKCGDWDTVHCTCVGPGGI